MFLSASRFDCKIAPKGVIFLVISPSYTVVYSGLGLPQGYISTCLHYAFRGCCCFGIHNHVLLCGWLGLRRLALPQGSPNFASCFSPLVDLTVRSPPRGLSFWLNAPPAQSCIQVLVCLRATFLPVSITPSGACAVVGPSHISLWRMIGGAQVGATSG